MNRFRTLLAATLMISAAAQAETYKIDPIHTQVVFYVSHVGFTTSIGKFRVSEGTVTYDAADAKSANTKITIDANSIDLNDDEWNSHMRGEHFLETNKYPTITFQSTKVEPQGSDKLKITGDLTLHGVTKSVAFDAKVNKIGAHPVSKKATAGFSGTTKIKRSDYGMSFGLPAIGDDIEIRLEVEANVG